MKNYYIDDSGKKRYCKKCVLCGLRIKDKEDERYTILDSETLEGILFSEYFVVAYRKMMIPIIVSDDKLKVWFSL